MYGIASFGFELSIWGELFAHATFDTSASRRYKLYLDLRVHMCLSGFQEFSLLTF